MGRGRARSTFGRVHECTERRTRASDVLRRCRCNDAAVKGLSAGVDIEHDPREWCRTCLTLRQPTGPGPARSAQETLGRRHFNYFAPPMNRHSRAEACTPSWFTPTVRADGVNGCAVAASARVSRGSGSINCLERLPASPAAGSVRLRHMGGKFATRHHRMLSTEHTDGGNLLVRFWRGPRVSNHPGLLDHPIGEEIPT